MDVRDASLARHADGGMREEAGAIRGKPELRRPDLVPDSGNVDMRLAQRPGESLSEDVLHMDREQMIERAQRVHLSLSRHLLGDRHQPVVQLAVPRIVEERMERQHQPLPGEGIARQMAEHLRDARDQPVLPGEHKEGVVRPDGERIVPAHDPVKPRRNPRIVAIHEDSAGFGRNHGVDIVLEVVQQFAQRCLRIFDRRVLMHTFKEVPHFPAGGEHGPQNAVEHRKQHIACAHAGFDFAGVEVVRIQQAGVHLPDRLPDPVQVVQCFADFCLQAGHPALSEKNALSFVRTTTILLHSGGRV